MKKILFALALSVTIFGCKKAPQPTPYYTGNNNFMEVLRVSYVGHTFTGGKELVFSTANPTGDSIPVTTVYNTPSDFGDITMTHTPSGDSMFAGTIVWMGTGVMSYPHLAAASTYPAHSGTIACPDSSAFQIVGPFSKADLEPIDYTAIWSAVNRLDVTAYMMQKHCKIGLYPYKPSVGFGNPNEWSWMIFLYK